MTDSIRQRMGADALPLEAADIGTELAFVDSTQRLLLGLFAAAIAAELDGAYAQVATGFTDNPSLSTSTCVASSHPAELSRELLGVLGVDYPALFVYRAGEQVQEQVTLELLKRSQEWHIDYLLGPLDVGTYRKLEALLKVHVPHVIRRVIERRGHPAYAGGATQWGTTATSPILGFGDNRVRVQAGPMDIPGFDAEHPFYISSNRVTVEETGDFEEGSEGTFDSVTYLLSGSTTGDMVQPFIEADSRFLPNTE
jgi:hypothetical protein